MAEVHPFRGWRYDVAQVGDLSDVTCPPYDVIDHDFQDRLYKQHPCNIIRVELNRDEVGDSDPDTKYGRATDFLRRWMQEGVLIQEREEALYVYHQIFESEGKQYTRRGFMGRIRLERFGEGRVYPHEQTLSGPKADRLKLLTATQMNLSPIFGIFPDDDSAVQAPLEHAILGLTPMEATDHLGVLHRMWPVTNRTVIEQVTRMMHDKPIFIADGHHRYETAINYRDGLQASGKLAGTTAPANYVMMMFVGMGDPGLVIMPTHRLVSGLAELTAAELTAALAGNFDVELIGTGSAAANEAWELVEVDGGQGIFGFGTPADDTWVVARVTDDSLMAQLAPEQTPAWRELGVSLLHKLVIEHLLKKHTKPGGPKFQYVHLLDEVTSAVQNKTCQLACLVPPARIEHVETIAEKLEKMPPKSTYFYPKLQSGLVFNCVAPERGGKG